MGECHSMSPSTPLPPAHKGAAQQHTASKTRPKIKIIHIIAPEIIKTDVSNFRELVQRLTGKPGATAATVDAPPPPLPPRETVEEERKEAAAIKKRLAPAPAAENGSFTVQHGNTRRKKKIKCEVKVEERGLGDGRDDHGELWMDLNPGGFLSFLEEDVFQGMMAPADFFIQPLDSSRNMDLVGEMYAS